MASMKRNLNLEEVNTDAFMGISFLKHQTILQKIIFWGDIIICIVVNIICVFWGEMDVVKTTFFAAIPLCFGVAFGCNYNEDLSLIKYLILLFSKPSKVYYSKSMDDISRIDEIENQLKVEMQLEDQDNYDEEQQKQFLKRFISIFVIGVIVFILVFMLLILQKKEKGEHHVVGVTYENRIEVLL